MRFEKNGRSGSRLWILCTICALLLGICFDSVQADSSLAYRDFAEAACDSGEYAGASALGAAKKGIPAQQAYVSETGGQGNNAIIPRRRWPPWQNLGQCLWHFVGRKDFSFVFLWTYIPFH